MKGRNIKRAILAAAGFVGAQLAATQATAQQQSEGDMCAYAANQMCYDNPYEFQDYDTCFRYYYNQYCPGGGNSRTGGDDGDAVRE